ncbi:uncharacterized protein ARMOST_18425 [Armillaria ostoyae]|uniref:Uncharacterized protein n=1 Tax=Armillaria ostoyae TaxID=47428 RepID=A0A284S1S7_ARMOS|nr:uncharacterized protein ARMOST_18425 [Armillaria ostoyae]
MWVRVRATYAISRRPSAFRNGMAAKRKPDSSRIKSGIFLSATHDIDDPVAASLYSVFEASFKDEDSTEPKKDEI